MSPIPTILHVDMDAFFAAVAIRDRPDLQGLPVIVGGRGRGVVLSATYEARAFGVRSGMPGGQARQLCPQAVFVSPEHSNFSSVSRSVMEIFHRVTSRVEALSLDEAFLDVSGILRADAEVSRVVAIAERIRAQVYDEQRITCSVGIAPVPSVAKLASRRAKPDGVVVVSPDRLAAFMHPLGAGELWGVGEKTRVRLEKLGLNTIGDVVATPLEVLQHALGRHAGRHVHGLATGTDGRTVGGGYATGAFGYDGGISGHDRDPGTRPDRPSAHSMGADETFGHDIDDPQILLREILRLSAKVAGRMRAANLTGRTVALRVRFADFTTITRSRTLGEPTDVTAEIYACAAATFASVDRGRRRIRLVGVRVEGLRPRGRMERQLVLGERPLGWPEADRAVDRAVTRFGRAAVVPASLLAGGRP